MFGVINLEFAVCSFSCVPFVLNSHCSHTPCFPCVAAFMKAICREHWEQPCHLSSSTFVLVPIMRGGSFLHKLPLFSHLPSNCWIDQEVAELTWAKLTTKMGQIDQKVGQIDLGRIDQKVGQIDQGWIDLVGRIDLGQIGTGQNWLEAVQ